MLTEKGCPKNAADAVKLCVAVVRANGPWAQGFGAFYNPAPGAVENDAAYAYQQSTLFDFDKCMAQVGFALRPLKP